MGSTQALGMAQQVDGGNLSLHAALRWHLTSNHYPPLPVVMIEACKAAIEAASEQDWERAIKLPKGVTHRKYGDSMPAAVLVESCHLDAFIGEEVG